MWESRVCRTRTPTLTLESCLESRIGVLGVRVRVRSTHTQREGRFSAISDGRSPGKRPPLAEIRGERIKAIATKGHRSTRKETLGGIPFCGFSCPFVAIPHCPSFAQCSMFSSRESPRSGVNVVGLRPSLIAQHSLRGFFSSIHAQGEGGFSAISAGRSPGKTPSLRGDSRE